MIISVLLPIKMNKALAYHCPDDISVRPGDYVRVPFRNQEKIGVVWAMKSDEKIPANKVKSIIEKIALPAMSQAHRDMISWMASYTLSDLGMVLKLSLSVPDAFATEKPQIGYQISSENIGKDIYAKLTDKQKKIIDFLRSTTPSHGAAPSYIQSELSQLSGASPSVIKTLHKKNLLTQITTYPSPPCSSPATNTTGPRLSPDQKMAADALCDAVENKITKPFLLDGVTGAGKTEVYFEAVMRALQLGKQVLILVPEIALSNAFLSRFEDRFQCAPALWHSALSQGIRKTTWRGVAKGQTKVIIGARSALMLPYLNLGLIIVDEEHDPAYKQEDGVLYNARDMAVLRSHKEKCPVILVSATPSLETIANCWAPPNGYDRYNLLTLPRRHGGAEMPDIHLVDMRDDKPQAPAHKNAPPIGNGQQYFISPTLRDAMEQTLQDKNQILLFLNRRGYAPLTLCRACGHRFECPRCTAWLIEHRGHNQLACHHCGYIAKKPDTCPSCEAKDSLIACGPGVERIAEEVRLTFPKARSLILSSDMSEDHDAMAQALDQIKSQEIDIIIGTQIIAKGHHFPHLALVGVIDADLGLSGGDLRAAERTYQLLHQVAGRAGREHHVKGHVYLQSFSPENRVMQALQSGERDLFLDIEAEQRQAAHMPPYARLAGIILSSTKEEDLNHFAMALAQSCPQIDGVDILGPAPAPIYRLRGRYRRRFLCIADKQMPLQSILAKWLSPLATKSKSSSTAAPADLRIAIDIDPQSFI